ncbi:hypothetical protein AeMF1_015696 [Aphanomyces euteiches]|nr:hypothetical protein AeMF1_015696 [Aphanomyces euteiches]
MSMLVRVWYGQYLLTLQTARRANWFSTKKPTISLERQQQILRVAQCVYELEGKPKTINLTPTKFIVPSTEPFPTDLRGKKFDIAVLRTAKQNGLLSPRVVAELDAIGFSWNGIQQNSTEAWKENLDALRTYKSIHGNLNIPSYYEVKMGDIQWPQKFWGKKLGLVVKRFRATRKR